MITAIGAPTATRLLAAIIPIVVRRNGMLQKYATPSRNGVRAPGSRFSWNGVRIRRRDAVEKAYETESTTNGTARASWNSAPPIGGATSRMVDIRAIATLDASASCGCGTTAFIAPLEPER